MVEIIQRVEIEDFGQDFLNFDLTADFKIANPNMQDWMWHGKQLKTTRPFKRHDQIVIIDQDETWALKYRVTKVRSLKPIPAAIEA